MWFGSSGLTEQERAGSSGCPVLPAPQPPPAGRDLPLCSWALRPQQTWVFFRTMAPSPAALLRFPKFPFKVSLSCLFRFLSLPLPWGDAESPDGSLHPPPPKPHASLRGEKPRRGLESSSLPPARLVLPQHRPLTPAPSPGAMGRAQSSSLGRRYLCLFVCLCVHASAVIRLLACALRLCACACTCVCVRAHACACVCTRAAPSPLPTSARWSRGSPHQRPPPGRRRCPRRRTPSPAARVTSWQETRPLARQVRPGRPGRVWLERTVLRLSTDLAATLRSDSPAQGSRAHGERAESTLILRGESEEGSACHLGLTMLKPQWGGGRAGEVSSLHVKKRDRTLEGPKPCSGPHS